MIKKKAIIFYSLVTIVTLLSWKFGFFADSLFTVIYISGWVMVFRLSFSQHPFARSDSRTQFKRRDSVLLLKRILTSYISYYVLLTGVIFILNRPAFEWSVIFSFGFFLLVTLHVTVFWLVFLIIKAILQTIKNDWS